jgi:hypothetical protein
MDENNEERNKDRQLWTSGKLKVSLATLVIAVLFGLIVALLTQWITTRGEVRIDRHESTTLSFGETSMSLVRMSSGLVLATCPPGFSFHQAGEIKNPDEDYKRPTSVCRPNPKPADDPVQKKESTRPQLGAL